MAIEHVEILVVGGGAAGISAAVSSWEEGCRSIMLVDRADEMGGVLLQCAHRGFGAGLTGREYADTLKAPIPRDIRLLNGTTVLEISEDKTALLAAKGRGQFRVSFDMLVLAAGCREVPTGALPIAGTRPKGVYTAGEMQARMNLDGCLPQGPVLILGSGDVGLVMANQLYESGVDVVIVESKEACGGMARNQKRIKTGEINVLCGRTVTEIKGYPQLEAVVLSDGSVIQCRTLLSAVGLKPERELIRTLGERDWLMLCGNCRDIHPMAETAAADGRRIGHLAYKKSEELKAAKA